MSDANVVWDGNEPFLAGHNRTLIALIIAVQKRIGKLGPALSKFKLYVDDREHDLVAFFEMQPWAKVVRLTTFDYVFATKTGKMFLGIERKTQADLQGSIIENANHFKDQIRKMRDAQAVLTSVLLEGDDPGNREFELNCEANALIRDRVSWIRSMSLIDTILVLYRYALAIFTFGTIDGSVLPNLEACETLQNVKKETDPILILTQMICTIPSFSGKKAQVVAQKYKNLKTLTETFNVKKAAELRYMPTGAAKDRRVGKSSAQKLYEFIHGAESIVPPKSAKQAKKKREHKIIEIPPPPNIE